MIISFRGDSAIPTSNVSSSDQIRPFDIFMVHLQTVNWINGILHNFPCLVLFKIQHEFTKAIKVLAVQKLFINSAWPHYIDFFLPKMEMFMEQSEVKMIQNLIAHSKPKIHLGYFKLI